MTYQDMLAAQRSVLLAKMDGYRLLEFGELLQVGDELLTWMDPDCTVIGWYTIKSMSGMQGEIVDEGMVPVRRRVDNS